jgi:dTDP-4-amino-4,6-dideoxygalactose transaminase
MLSSDHDPLGPFDWPRPDAEVRAALEAAYADGSWGKYHGGHTARLADALRGWLNVEHALLCCSGTFAVQLALRGLGIGAGDEVILAGYDFPGNFRAIEAAGARTVLVDVVRGGVTLEASLLADACSPATRAVIVSHLHGTMAPMSSILAVARERGLMVIEDACQVPGARVDGRLAGTWGDVGVFSFGGSKLLTAGRGGAIVTSRPEVAQRAKVYCEQGNNAFPLSELQAAVVLPQLGTLADLNAHRRTSAQRLIAALAECSAIRPLASTAAGTEAAYYKVGLWLYPDGPGEVPRERFIAAAQRLGVPVDAGFRGFVHRGPRRCRLTGALDQSRRAAEQFLVLHHPVLLEPPEVIDAVAAALVRVAGEAVE